MSSNKQEVCLKGRTELAQMIEHLENLVGSLKEGTVCVQNGHRSVTLHPEGLVEMCMEAKTKDGEEKISFSVSWCRSEPNEEGLQLTISSKEPQPVADEDNG